jgi:dynein heavy chain
MQHVCSILLTLLFSKTLLKETYGAQPPIELLRQWFDQSGWYDRKALVFRRIIDTSFVSSMGPPGGGRNPITPRFLRHFNMIGYAQISDASKQIIFSTILTSFVQAFPPAVQAMSNAMVKSTILVYNRVTAELLPTPAKTHYMFNLRDLAKVVQGVLMGSAKHIDTPEKFVRLWVHESQRVFQDRMTNDTDRNWFKDLLKDMTETEYVLDWNSIYNQERLFFGDYMIPGADPKVYTEVEDISKLQPIIEDYLMDHNAESKSPMPLVMFLDAIEHVSRISRVIRQPQGNALLLGVGGSGRQSLSRLATFIAGYKLFQVEIVKGYGVAEWREDVKTCLLDAGLNDKPVVFLFSDVQVVDELMLEDTNGILNAGDIPNLYAAEDIDAITQACRMDCQQKGLPATKLNIFGQYIIRVRRNIHVCLCMSPVGEQFRDRLRMFPSIVNCCTIDWFAEWPAQALNSVANAALDDSGLKLGDDKPKLVEMFKYLHQSVEEKSREYLEAMRRHNYVTPTSYLELLSTFKNVLGSKKEEVSTAQFRLQNGVNKITETKGLVDGMKDKLVTLQPQLTKTQAEVDVMMVQITEDKKQAAVTKEHVEKEEAAANIKAAATKEIADSAQSDLDEALPALAAAVECLNKLKKADLDEVKSLTTPPGGVKLTMEAACIMFGHKPVMKNDPDKIGKKYADYWETAKKTLLADVKAFLAGLFAYDKDNIPEATINKIKPYIEMEEFTPKAIEKASKACTAICMWVRAMNTYHHVALGVEPKKIALAAAQEELDVTLAALENARGRLKAVMDRLDELETNFNAATTKKEELVAKVVEVQVQLSNAEKLLSGLGGEEVRWKESVRHMEAQMINLRGDVLISAGTIAYLGAFTFEYRQVLCTGWRKQLGVLGLSHTANCDITTTLVEPVKLQQWQMSSLPVDNVSTQNGIIMARGRRWPLCIDPQGQANRFIKNLGKNPAAAENGLEVVKMSDKNFLRALENGVRFGRWVLLENIGEELDAALEPILLQQKFKESGQDMIKLGDSNVPYNNSFKFFISTKLPNPHYAPEVCVKVTLLNFTITMSGLEEQLLGVVVKEEMPELAERKAALIVENAACNEQLFTIESTILHMLAHSEGNILDDTVLIETLSQAKLTSIEVNEKKREAETTEKEIDETSNGYRPVAFRAALLFFCIADLENVDPMYSYSLQWFTSLFVKGVQSAEAASKLEVRLENLKNFFTYSIYRNVCRSLFAAHKTLFSFLLAIKVLQGSNKVDALEYRFLLSGFSPTKVDVPNPSPEWVEVHAWAEISYMSGLPNFQGFAETFHENAEAWRAVFDSSDPPSVDFPAPWDTKLTILQRILVIRCLRPDKLLQIIQKFVSASLGQRFIEPPPFDLPGTFADSQNVTPLIFILSPGSDPQKELTEFAVEMGMDSSLKSIALGQGQGKIAANMIEVACAKGEWVMLQNCHLCVSWMPELERICEEFDADKMHNDFRLWLTSMPTKAFPTSVLQNGVKMTKEAPKGLRANLQNTYFTLNNEKVSKSNKPAVYQKLLFGLCFFHANACERKKFGPLGWNIPYAFNETDLDISMNQMELFLNDYDDVPYMVLNFLFSVINYGGRITDDKDIRTIAVILEDMMAATTLAENHAFSRSGTYKSITPDPDNPHQSYVEYIESLPLEPAPEVFGMHENANIACDQTEAFHNMDIILALQPRMASGGGLTRDEIVENLAKSIEEDLFPVFDLEAIGMKYPTDYNESMNTTLVQEISRYNKLLGVMKTTLSDIQKGLKGLVVMSAELENMGTAMFNQKVPVIWESVAYPSLQPLTVWVKDLLKRLQVTHHHQLTSTMNCKLRDVHPQTITINTYQLQIKSPLPPRSLIHQTFYRPLSLFHAHAHVCVLDVCLYALYMFSMVPSTVVVNTISTIITAGSIIIPLTNTHPRPHHAVHEGMGGHWHSDSLLDLWILFSPRVYDRDFAKQCSKAPHPY